MGTHTRVGPSTATPITMATAAIMLVITRVTVIIPGQRTLTDERTLRRILSDMRLT